FHVTGVQTCALPIYTAEAMSEATRTTVMPYVVTGPGSDTPATALMPPVSAIRPTATTTPSSAPTASRGAMPARRATRTSGSESAAVDTSTRVGVPPLPILAGQAGRGPRHSCGRAPAYQFPTAATSGFR